MITSSNKIKGVFVFFIFCIIYIIITVNLYVIQVVQTNFFKDLAERQYKVTVTQQPPRGIIYDHNGKPIALNKESIAAFILPHKIEQKKMLHKFLKQHFPQAYQRLQTKNNTQTYFMYVKRRLIPQEIQLIEQAKLPDIKFIREPSRFYPYACMSTIIGLTDIDNKGLFGLEHYYNTMLTGEPTTYSVEKDARSGLFYFQKETTKTGKESHSLTLTIDSDLQFFAHEELAESVQKLNAQEGAAIVMEPKTGAILAMTNYPIFNSQEYAVLDLEKTKNKVLTESYELGSVMKIFVALAALAENVVTPDELIDCENTKTAVIDGMRFTTVHPDGIIPFAKVVVDSNNIGMVKVAKRLNTKLVDHYKRMGFGQKTGIKFPGEQQGYVSPPQCWSKRSIISLSFGYEITATLLQLARAVSVIANNGINVRPYLVIDQNIKQHSQEQIYTPEAIIKIKEIMKQTVEEGTAKRAAIKGYNIMGKTGTANMVINRQYSQDHNIYTFAGIIEKGNYKRVIVTFIKDSPLKNLYAANTTAPLFEKITEKMLIHDKII